MTTIGEFLSRDHDRLDALFEKAAIDPNGIDLDAYGEFRRGLLKHVGMEEKILLPAVRRFAGKPLSLAARMRLEHGAITALLIPTPNRFILAALSTILKEHNLMEEDVRDGAYVLCERAAGAAGAKLLRMLRSAPDIPPAVHADGPRVLASVRRALEAAGYGALGENLRP